MSNSPKFKPEAVVRPAKKEARLLASQIKRPPAQRLAEALLIQFPDIDIKLRDGGFTAAAIRNETAVMLCEQYDAERDGREGWWTLMDTTFPQLVAFFQQVPPAPGPANDDVIEGVEAEADGG